MTASLDLWVGGKRHVDANQRSLQKEKRVVFLVCAFFSIKKYNTSLWSCSFSLLTIFGRSP